MANEQIHQAFDQFISGNPTSRYEDWIANLHPESAEDGLLGLGQTIIDTKYYNPDNEYLKYWNEHIESGRAPVMVASNTNGNEIDTPFFDVDLLSGDGEGDSQASPPVTPRKTVTLSPGEDMMKFD